FAVGYLGEVERGAVLDRDGEERPPAARRRQSHDLAEEARRRLRIAGGHDGVVEGDRHGASLSGRACPTSPGVEEDDLGGRCRECDVGSVRRVNAVIGPPSHEENIMAKYLLLKHYRGAPAPVNDVSMDQWAPDEVEAHIRFM